LKKNIIKNIIFDLGGVLIDWNPKHVYLDVFDGDKQKMNWFLDNICTEEWNLNQDAGYSIEKATNELIYLFPKYEYYIKIYYERWEEMLKGKIDESVYILNKLIPNYKVFALTNWSSETFPIALKKFKFLKSFLDIIVSGEEKIRKPDPKIFKLAIDRFNIKVNETIFIDDNTQNIKSAKKIGFITHHFQNPKKLIMDLKNKNIKI